MGRGSRLWLQFKKMVTQTSKVPVEMEKNEKSNRPFKRHEDIILGQTGNGQFKEKEELKMTQGLEVLPGKIGMVVSESVMGQLEYTANVRRENIRFKIY